MNVFIANFGEGNYLWPKCLERQTVATIDEPRLHDFWLRRDRAGYIEFALRHAKTARLQAPTSSVASRWYGLADAIASTGDDIWIHREKEELWWTKSLNDDVEISRCKAVNFKRDGDEVIELHKPTEAWRNRNTKGGLLSWSGLHPKARTFMFTEGTLQKISEENAQYALALIAGESLDRWHQKRDWVTKSEKSRRYPVVTFSARQKAIVRMVDTALDTVNNANGQIEIRLVKEKNTSLEKNAFQEILDNLLTDQDRLCAITGIPLQLDGEYDDKELLCSLDRIDSNGHYEAGNLQIVCRFINRWKSNSDDASFRRLVALIKSSNFE
jgi:hypothetical protein